MSTSQQKISYGQYTDEKCSLLSVITEMQIKTTIRKYYTPTRMAEIKKTNKNEEQTATLLTGREVMFLQLF